MGSAGCSACGNGTGEHCTGHGVTSDGPLKAHLGEYRPAPELALKESELKAFDGASAETQLDEEDATRSRSKEESLDHGSLNAASSATATFGGKSPSSSVATPPHDTDDGHRSTVPAVAPVLEKGQYALKFTRGDTDVLGLDVEVGKEEEGLLITGLQPGIVADWNAEQPEGQCVRVGDCIVQVNQVQGNAREMLSELRDPTPSSVRSVNGNQWTHSLVLRQPQDSSHILERNGRTFP